MKPFLEKIADRLLRKFPTSMEGTAVVLPSKRVVVFFPQCVENRQLLLTRQPSTEIDGQLVQMKQDPV